MDEMTLKVRHFRALRVEVMGTVVGPLPEHCSLGQQVDSAHSVHSRSHHRGVSGTPRDHRSRHTALRNTL